MAGKHWNDVNKVAVRLKAHRLAGLMSLDLEGNNRVNAIGAIRLDRPPLPPAHYPSRLTRLRGQTQATDAVLKRAAARRFAGEVEARHREWQELQRRVEQA